VFWSKIWLFLVTLAAALALTVALVLPRPAQRARVGEEHERLVHACSVVKILLADNARNRVDVAGAFARHPDVVSTLIEASSASSIDEGRAKKARDLARKVRQSIGSEKTAGAHGDDDQVKPDFVILLDRKGRVVTRLGIDEGDWGDTMAGRPAVDAALAGYLRDDLWTDRQKQRLFLVSVAPVVKRDPPVAYEGAVVLGYGESASRAESLVKALEVDLEFDLGATPVASTSKAVLSHDQLAKAVPTGASIADDCTAKPPFDVTAGDRTYSALVARLPGEARHAGAFYTTFIKRPAGAGFSATLGAVKQQDLGWGSFPWLLVGICLVLALGAGMFLLVWESDRPLRRLAADAVRLAKGESERMAEDDHHGKFGSIARSVNIHIDKLAREARSAKKDLDQLLGPAPEGSLGALDLVGTPLPAARPGVPAAAPASSFTPPPPSEFKFGDQGGAPPPRPPVATPPAGTPGLDLPPPKKARANTPPPIPPASPAPPRSGPPRTMDDDILGTGGAPAGGEDGFRSVFEQFVEMKQKCGESTSGLTFAKFADKLRKNRNELISRTGVRQVKFTVYVKDGKAALKATPVKD
jgi:hypothetical protein